MNRTYLIVAAVAAVLAITVVVIARPRGNAEDTMPGGTKQLASAPMPEVESLADLAPDASPETKDANGTKEESEVKAGGKPAEANQRNEARSPREGRPNAEARPGGGNSQRAPGEERGGRGFQGFNDVLEKVNLTADQKKAIGVIFENHMKALQAARSENESMTREQRREQFGKHREKLLEQINGVLTAEQKAKFEELLKEQQQRRQQQPQPDRRTN